jgi:hypothetical protein
MVLTGIFHDGNSEIVLVFQHDNARCHVARVCPYHRICRQLQLNIDVMNSVDVFTPVKIARKHYRSCTTKPTARSRSF